MKGFKGAARSRVAFRETTVDRSRYQRVTCTRRAEIPRRTINYTAGIINNRRCHAETLAGSSIVRMAGFLRPGAPGSASENNARGERDEWQVCQQTWKENKKGGKRRRNPRYRMLIRVHCTPYRCCSRGCSENRITNYTETWASLPF